MNDASTRKSRTSDDFDDDCMAVCEQILSSLLFSANSLISAWNFPAAKFREILHNSLFSLPK